MLREGVYVWVYISVGGLIAHVSLNKVHSVAYHLSRVQLSCTDVSGPHTTRTSYGSSQLLYQLLNSLVDCRG